MGATQTTFCNESAIPISTGLSVWITYYFTETLLPQQCVTYSVGRVWFTAFAQLSFGYDPIRGFNQIYFLTNETTAVGMQIYLDAESYAPPDLKYLSVTPDEAEYIMAESVGFVPDNLEAVGHAISPAMDSLYTSSMGYYAGSDHKIRVMGGPKRTIQRIDSKELHVHILPLKHLYPIFQLHIDS